MGSGVVTPMDYFGFLKGNCILRIQELVVIKTSLSMKCIKGQVGKSNKSTMLVKFASLPYGFQLFKDNIHDENEPLMLNR